VKLLFSIFTLASTISLTIAQTQQSILVNYDSVLRDNQSKFDSIFTRTNTKIDSLQLRANSILNPNLSVDQVFTRLRERRLALTDTLKAKKALDSIKGGLQHQIDSLSHLSLPTDKYKRTLDSISQFSPQTYLDKVNHKVSDVQSRINKPLDDLESKINKPVNDLEAKVNEKLTLMNNEGGAAANLPGNTNLQDINVPGADLKTPELNLNTDLDLNLNVPGVPDIKNPLTDIENPLSGEMEQLDVLKDKVNGVKDIPQQQIDRLNPMAIGSIDEVEAIQDKAGQANALIDKAQAYQQDVSKIAQGDLSQVEEIPKAIESRIASMDEMKELQKQTGQVTQYQEMLAKGNDPEALKAMAKEAAVKYATDHFAGKQEALHAAMDKMSKLKSKYSQVSSLKDLPKRVPNPMKNKPFIERLVPGFAFQIQKANTFMIDLNPTLAWRFTGRFTAGAGWNERLSFEKWNQVVAQDRIYGPRAFSSFSFRKGFSLKAEVEKMNTFVPTTVGTPFYGTNEARREWVWSVFAGFKKDYTFYKKIKGNVQVLYNLYDDHDNSPYVDRLNVRMGFEVGMKKKRKID
jgi:hypothetical protein